MRHLSVFLAIFMTSSCALRAQQNIATGVNIYPNAAGSAGGYVKLYDAARALTATMQPSANNSVVFTGATTTMGSAFSFQVPHGGLVDFCDTVNGGKWEFTRVKLIGYQSSSTGCGGTINYDVHVDGTIRTSLGIGFYENSGLSGDAIGMRAPSGGVTTAYTFTLPGNPGTSGYALTTNGSGTTSWSAVMTNPMTTTGDIIIGGASGVPTRLAAGTNGYWLQMQSGSPAWAQIDPAWTSYSPSVVASSGATVTTTSSAYAYIQTGKTVKVRIVWTGSLSTTSASIGFSTPVTPSSAGYQSLSAFHQLGADSLSVSSLVIPSGINLIAVQKDGAGGLFPSGTSFTIVTEGVYESD